MATEESSIPVGLCQCGCGQRTPIATRTERYRGWVGGQPKRFCRGHSSVRPYVPPADGWCPNDSNGFPPGVCQCGCGQATTIASQTNNRRGYKKGQYRPFVIGHGLHRKCDEPHDSPVRTCRVCREQKPVSAFKVLCGLPIWRCKKCEVERVRKWGQKHPRHKRDFALRKLFGIGLDDYERMLQEQCGACAICGRPEVMIDPRTKVLRNLAVDHCHKTNRVRGLLCGHCNRALGAFREDEAVLLKAVEYLRRHRQD